MGGSSRDRIRTSLSRTPHARRRSYPNTPARAGRFKINFKFLGGGGRALVLVSDLAGAFIGAQAVLVSDGPFVFRHGKQRGCDGTTVANET